MGHWLWRASAAGILLLMTVVFAMRVAAAPKTATGPLALTWLSLAVLWWAARAGCSVATRFASPRHPDGPEGDYYDPPETY
jgi:hypothetical protein